MNTRQKIFLALFIVSGMVVIAAMLETVQQQIVPVAVTVAFLLGAVIDGKE